LFSEKGYIILKVDAIKAKTAARQEEQAIFAAKLTT
jgi:hypothetical protein